MAIGTMSEKDSDKIMVILTDYAEFCKYHLGFMGSILFKKLLHDSIGWTEDEKARKLDEFLSDTSFKFCYDNFIVCRRNNYDLNELESYREMILTQLKPVQAIIFNEFLSIVGKKLGIIP